jgi:flagellar motor protein MotB
MPVLRAPTVDTEVNYWPGVIDMLTSLLMFFMLVSFVQQNVNPASLAAEIADQKQRHFQAVFDREFAIERARSEISVDTDLNLLQITFGEEILFERGKHTLRARGQTMLRRVANVIREVDDSTDSPLYDQIQIEGHTDSMRMTQPQYPHNNWELSTARALEVLTFLTRRSDPRLSEKRMSVNGYADTRPIDVSNHEKNRRIEIRIYFSGRQARKAG